MHRYSPGRKDAKGSFRRWSLFALASVAILLATSGLAKQPTIAHRSSIAPNAGVPSNALIPIDQGLLSSNGLTDEVQWDNFSLVVKGQRIFLQYVVIASPSFCWLDVFNKLRGVSHFQAARAFSLA